MEVPRQVRCCVENCRYNKDRLCHARSLDVGAMGNSEAETSGATCCETFVNRK